MIYVLDTSVILKWYLKEKDSDIAVAFKESYVKGDIDLIEPDLVLYEISNALRFQKNIDLKDIYCALENFINLEMEILTPKISFLRESAKKSLRYNITVYDASYLTLADEIANYFVTADEKLFNKISNLKFVKLLSGYRNNKWR